MTVQNTSSGASKAEGASEGRVSASRNATPSVRPAAFVTEETVVTRPLTATMAMALAQHFGLTDEDITLILTAQAPTPEESQFAAKVDSDAIARAYSPAVTRALADAQCPIAVKCAKPHALEGHAARVRHTARVVTKLQEGTDALERSVRGDADVLDKVTREVVPQVKARAAVVPETATRFSSVLAYHRARYPGPGKKTKAPRSDT